MLIDFYFVFYGWFKEYSYSKQEGKREQGIIKIILIFSQFLKPTVYDLIVESKVSIFQVYGE